MTENVKPPPEVDLGAVPDATLIRVLERRGYSVSDDEVTSDVDTGALEHAADHLRRGDAAEALIWLERALPDRFAGLASAVVPAPSR